MCVHVDILNFHLLSVCKITIVRTRRFIGEELILAIDDFLKICQYIKSFNYCFSQTNLPNITLANKSFCTVHVCSSLCKLDIT